MKGAATPGSAGTDDILLIDAGHSYAAVVLDSLLAS
jgi:hypothetical protein